MKLRLPDTPSDPKLKAAMEDIKEVLTKHDIAGMVIIQSPTHAEWLNHISPSWSCAQLEATEDGGLLIRVRALAKDYPTPEAHQETVASTAGMIISFSECARKLADNMDKVADMVGKQVGIEHIGKFDR